jgi:hypothetical protein
MTTWRSGSAAWIILLERTALSETDLAHELSLGKPASSASG